jgi:hypothetical protein
MGSRFLPLHLSKDKSAAEVAQPTFGVADFNRAAVAATLPAVAEVASSFLLVAHPAFAHVGAGFGGGFFSGFTHPLLIAGLGGAIRFKIHDTILVVLAAAGACLIGTETGKAVGVLSPGAFITGASLSPLILLVYFLGGLERLRSEWQAIACRAVASWIAAIGIMMLTFEFWQPHVQGHRP